MLVGHLAVGLVAKRVEPRISLGTCVLAVMLADLLVFPLMIAGIEHFDVVSGVESNRVIGRNIVYSHSLLMDAIWGTLLAAAYFLRRHSLRGAWILWLAVLSHWLLDLVSHRPDMPLAPGIGVVLGLGLWNSIPLTLIVEGGFWLLAIVLYVRATRAKRRAGVYLFWGGIALITLVWYGNINNGMDPDPVKAGVGGLVLFSLLVAWAYLSNRLRTSE
jgi:membrane-bound metal-dependent hydrolase YbcI (DUF457 family)